MPGWTIVIVYGTSEGNLDRLQRVQNQLARVVLQAPWTASATDIRRQLHWLPVRQRIVFKLATVTYRPKPRMPGLPAYTYNVKFTITIRLELYAQLRLFSFSNNQPLYHLQRERFVQPLLH